MANGPGRKSPARLPAGKRSIQAHRNALNQPFLVTPDGGSATVQQLPHLLIIQALKIPACHSLIVWVPGTGGKGLIQRFPPQPHPQLWQPPGQSGRRRPV